jgi:hypothetical protein
MQKEYVKFEGTLFGRTNLGPTKIDTQINDEIILPRLFHLLLIIQKLLTECDTVAEE